MKWDQVGQVGHGISTALCIVLLVKVQLTWLSKKKNSGEFNWLLFVNKLFVHENSWIVFKQLLKKVLEFYTALLRTMNCAVDLPF